MRDIITHRYDCHIEHVPHAKEVGQLVYPDLHRLLDDVVDDEDDKDALASQDEKVPGGHVAEKLQSLERGV